MEALIKKYWPFATMILGAVSPMIVPPIQTFVNAHPELYGALAWIVAHLIPSPVPSSAPPAK